MGLLPDTLLGRSSKSSSHISSTYLYSRTPRIVRSNCLTSYSSICSMSNFPDLILEIKGVTNTIKQSLSKKMIIIITP